MTKKREQTKRIKRAAAKAAATTDNITYLPHYRSAKALEQWEEAKEESGHPLIVDHGDLILGTLLLLTGKEEKVNAETIHLTQEDGMQLLQRWFMKTAAKQLEEMRKPKLALMTDLTDGARCSPGCACNACKWTDGAPTVGGAAPDEQ